MEKGRHKASPHLVKFEHNLNPAEMNAKISFAFKRATYISSEAIGRHIHKLLYVITGVH